MNRVSAAIAGMIMAGTAQAGPVAFDKSWSHQKFSLFSRNSYDFQGRSLAMSSDGSVSLIWRALPETEWPARNAKWDWAVETSVPGTDLRRKGGDDRNLSLYFVFLPEDQAKALKGSSVTKVLRNPAARVLVYVWGGSHKRGAVLSSPYLDNRGKTIVLRGAGKGSASEAVDLSRDYARAFGGAPGALVGLAVSGDSDDTDSQIRARLSALRLN